MRVAIVGRICASNRGRVVWIVVRGDMVAHHLYRAPFGFQEKL